MTDDYKRGLVTGLAMQPLTVANTEALINTPLTNYEYINDLSVRYNGVTYTVEKDITTGLISKITDSNNNYFKPTINSGITDVALHNAVFWAVAMHSGLSKKPVDPYILRASDDGTTVVYGAGAQEMALLPRISGSYSSDSIVGNIYFAPFGRKVSDNNAKVPIIGVYKSYRLNESQDNYADSIIGYIDGVDLTDWSEIQISYGLRHNYSAGLTTAAYFAIGEVAKVESNVKYDWSNWKLVSNNGVYDSVTYPDITDVYTFDISEYSGVQRLNFGVYHGDEVIGYSVGFFIDEIKLIK